MLSSDAMRITLTGDVTNQSVNRQVFRGIRRCLEALLKARAERVVVDSTAVTRWERRSWIRWAELHGCRVEAVFFDVPRAVCEERNAARGRVVPAGAMETMFSRLERPRVEEGFDRLTTIVEPASRAGREPG